MNNTISIIVPIYNSEEYLNKCIKSIIEQTYTELEIILVDDGSTDSSLEICHNWAEKDARIVVLHKENGGQGSARNMALDIVKGDYIGFIDSDDYIEKNMYEVLFENIKKYEASISTCSNGTACKTTYTDNISLFTQPEIMLEHLQGHPGTGQSPCDKLFKKELFNDVRFAETRAYEDCATLYLVLAKAIRMVYQDTVLYHYIVRKNSTMTQTFSEVKFQAVLAYQGLYEFYSQNYPQYANVAKKKVIGTIKYCIGEMCNPNKQEKYYPYINQMKQMLIKNSYDGLKVKDCIQQFVMLHMTKLYGAIYRVFKK